MARKGGQRVVHHAAPCDNVFHHLLLLAQLVVAVSEGCLKGADATGRFVVGHPIYSCCRQIGIENVRTKAASRSSAIAIV